MNLRWGPKLINSYYSAVGNVAVRSLTSNSMSPQETPGSYDDGRAGQAIQMNHVTTHLWCNCLSPTSSTNTRFGRWILAVDKAPTTYNPSIHLLLQDFSGLCPLARAGYIKDYDIRMVVLEDYRFVFASNKALFQDFSFTKTFETDLCYTTRYIGQDVTPRTNQLVNFLIWDTTYGEAPEVELAFTQTLYFTDI